MRTQQQAEREEQQRIKNLVLNYDLQDTEDQDGDSTLQPIQPNCNIHKSNAGIEKLNISHARPDKSGNNRSGQRSRKLQLSDVDFLYDNNSHRYKHRPGGSPLRFSSSSTRRGSRQPGSDQELNANVSHCRD